jgi:hypothetical protein
MQEEASARRFDPAAQAGSPGENSRSARPATQAILGKRPPLPWGEAPAAAQHWKFSPENGRRPTFATRLRNEDYPLLPTFYGSRRLKFSEIFDLATWGGGFGRKRVI